MSFPSPSRYRSRLLNFLNRQARRWVEKSDRALRHLQVGTQWGVQIVLYPIYVMFQSARLATRQLKQSMYRGTDALNQMVTADASIEQVLEAAKERGEGITQDPAPIIGIASLLETHTLVLVNSKNQILDILTPEQQQQLQKQISWEVADYWRERHLVRSQPQTTTFLPPLEDRANLFGPIRVFRQVMGWIQTGSVAAIINLFQEETLIQNLEAKSQRLKLKSQELKLKSQKLKLKSQQLVSPAREGEEDRIPPAFISTLDRAIADLEAGSLAPVLDITASILHRSQEFLQRVRNRWLGSQVTLLNLPPADLENYQADRSKIQSLIQAAIDYFFGRRRQKLFESETAVIDPLKQLEGTTEEAPWLTQNELFGAAAKLRKVRRYRPEEALEYINQMLGEESNPSVLPPGQPNPQNPDNIPNFVNRHLNSQSDLVLATESHSVPPNSKDTSSSDKSQPSETNPQKTTRVSPSRPIHPLVAIRLRKTSSNTNSFDRPEPEIDPTSEWIETKATPTGYVKHPLERILEWLDRAILWLENLIVMAWRWAKQLFNRT